MESNDSKRRGGIPEPYWNGHESEKVKWASDLKIPERNGTLEERVNQGLGKNITLNRHRNIRGKTDV